MISAQAITWAPCPAGQMGVDCAFVPLPLDPANPALGTVVNFVRRFYANNVTQHALWMISGGPGDSGNAFGGGAEYWLTVDPSKTIYVPDQRGVGLSNGLHCDTPIPGDFDPNNATCVALYAACNAQLTAKYQNVSQYFSTYHGAVDLKALIDGVSSVTVAIYALSYGTYLTNMYLQLPGARADVLVLDGPAAPNRWALENYAVWSSRVSNDVLSVCAAVSANCAAHVGSEGQLPGYVMDAIVDGTLPCLAQLPWLSHKTASDYNQFMTANSSARVLLGPFWARLLRCSTTDVDQLNIFHARRQALTSAMGDPSDPSYSYGLAVNIGASELYTYAEDNSKALTYADQVVLGSRVFNNPWVQLVVSFARDEAPVPRYTPDNSTYRKYAKVHAPTLITVGTLDAQTPHGLGAWFQQGLGPNAQVVTVPFSVHGTLGMDTPCVASIITTFLHTFGAPPDLTCLAQIQSPDFDGTLEATFPIVEEYFGTANLWNGEGANGGGGVTLSMAGVAGLSVGGVFLVALGLFVNRRFISAEPAVVAAANLEAASHINAPAGHYKKLSTGSSGTNTPRRRDYENLI